MWSNVEFYNHCEKGNIQQVRLMLFNRKGEWLDWNDALRSGCTSGNLEIINVLIANGARDWDNGARGAAEGNHIHVLEMMLRLGISDLNIPFICASRRGNIDIIVYLMKKYPRYNWDFNRGLKYSSGFYHYVVSSFMLRNGANEHYLGNCNQGFYLRSVL